MKKALFRVTDAVVVAAVLLAAFVCLALARGGAPNGKQAVVHVAGQSPITYDLSVSQTVTVAGLHGHSLTVTIQNGQVRIAESTCPDRVCVHTGWLSRGGQAAVCVPSGVTVRVVGGSDAVDGVTA